MPMNSEAPRRARIRSGESWSRPSPESTMKRRGWNVVSALIALVAIGRAQLTGTPSATSAAARFRFAAVMRLMVPSSSSVPQRPQLLRLEIILITSLSVRVRSEEHTSELQSPCNLVCRLLLEKKKQKYDERHRQAAVPSHLAVH